MPNDRHNPRLDRNPAQVSIRAERVSARVPIAGQADADQLNEEPTDPTAAEHAVDKVGNWPSLDELLPGFEMLDPTLAPSRQEQQESTEELLEPEEFEATLKHAPSGFDTIPSPPPGKDTDIKR